MRVIVVEPGREPEVREIENTLEAWQAIVGGYVEAAPLGRKLTLFVHRDGIDLALAYNRRIGEHDVVGPAFIASSNSRTGQTCGLDDKALDHAQALLAKSHRA